MGCTYSIRARFDIKDEARFCESISRSLAELHASKTFNYIGLVVLDPLDAFRMATGDPYASEDKRTGLWSADVSAGYGWSERMYYIFEKALAFCNEGEVEVESWEDAGGEWHLIAKDGEAKEI